MISILLPTTGRAKRVERCLEGLFETTDPHPIEVVLAVDNDEETFARVVNIDHPSRASVHVDYVYGYRGNTAWNDCLAEASGDPVVFAADDLDWQEGWLDAALEALENHPDCLIGFNDGHLGPELSTHYLMPRKFIVEVLGGRVAWPCYKHSFNDLETNDRAKAAGRYHWCKRARVFHDHWLFGGRDRDDTDTRNLGGHAESEAAYKQRRATGFPDDWPAIIQ